MPARSSGARGCSISRPGRSGRVITIGAGGGRSGVRSRPFATLALAVDLAGEGLAGAGDSLICCSTPSSSPAPAASAAPCPATMGAAYSIDAHTPSRSPWARASIHLHPHRPRLVRHRHLAVRAEAGGGCRFQSSTRLMSFATPHPQDGMTRLGPAEGFAYTGTLFNPSQG